MDKSTILSLLEQIKKVEKSNEGRLPQNSFFLDYDKVVCGPRKIGESRYPYDTDGLTVWLRSTGFIDAMESNFNIFKTANFGEESAVSFFGGIKNGENDYTPVSITGASRSADESGITRYIMYTLKCAYCITEAYGFVFVLRVHNDENKHIHFSLNAINVSGEKKEFYLASFMEAILRYTENEAEFWSILTKFSRRYDNGAFTLTSKNASSFDTLVITNKICSGKLTKKYSTCSRVDFLGAKGLAIANSASLRSGSFEKQVLATAITDLPVASDIFHFSADDGECVRVEYDLLLTHSPDSKEAEKYINHDIDIEKIDKNLDAAIEKEKTDFDNLKIRFEDWNSNKTTADTFSKFIRSAQKQTTVCAHGKNYAGVFLGIRDVFQQLEGSLIWQSSIAREKILAALDNILVTGRPPRQYTIPVDPKADVYIDLFKYIDQGVWVISTIYTYLAYTNDYSILDEECGYVESPEDLNGRGYAKRSEERDSVLCHLKRIMDYLLSNVDEEYGTGCVRVLFGDWNDAVDGLGETEDEGKEFGSGVTVMATLQFYQNLREMSEILKKVGDAECDALCKKYAEAAEKIEKGLMKHAVDTNEKGERRIVHGWGDKIGYKVGSFNDTDGVARYSLTANSFWAITKFLHHDPTLKSSIMDCMDAVSSKYGLKTFDIPFPEDAKGVGRIVSLIPGTYENSCAYAHGSLFGTMAMFEMGESERAWEEIEKSIVITHDNCTKTTFAMPNSYCENPEYSMDGESMGDWHTGSGAVIVKETIRYGFGIFPVLDGLQIQFPKYFPAKRGEISINVKGSKVKLTYENKGIGKRTIDIKGASDILEKYDDLMGINTYFIPEDKMQNEINITICD